MCCVKAVTVVSPLLQSYYLATDAHSCIRAEARRNEQEGGILGLKRLQPVLACANERDKPNLCRRERKEK